MRGAEGQHAALYASDFAAVASAFGLQRPILVAWYVSHYISMHLALFECDTGLIVLLRSLVGALVVRPAVVVRTGHVRPD